MPFRYSENDQAIISKLIGYFKNERDAGGPLLPLTAVYERMVYPEKLNLDQVLSKSNSRPSWCNDPIERHIDFVHVASNKKEHKLKRNRSDEECNGNKVEPIVDDTSENNHQFIQDRIRHLVDAFSTRAHVARQRLEGLDTPSTPSSSAEVDDNPSPEIVNKRKLSVSFSDKYQYNDDEPEVKITRNGCLGRMWSHVGIIDPNGRTYVIWMCIITMTVVYNAWVIPLRSTFPYQTSTNRAWWMTFDYLSDLMYIMDFLLIQPRVKYLQEGFWVMEKSLLRHNYIKNKHFRLDVFSLLPLDIFYLLLGPDLVILRLPRLLKIHTFWQFFSLVDKRLSNPYTIRITKTIIYMFYLIHLNACAYYAFSIFEGIGSNSFVFSGEGNAYIKCFYFATKTATSIGKNPKPTQDLEYIFMTFSWLLGVFVFALLIGQIRDIISTASRSKTEYRKLVDETLEYMRRMNLPQEMQRRVQLWFSYTWETQRTLDENNIMDCLPIKMKTDIAINVHMNTLNKVKLFADCDEALRRELVLELKSVIYLPGVFVFALLIGQIRDIISTASRSKTEYRKLVDETLEYMRRMNLPQEMQRRVQLWFSYTWETQRTLDENNIMDCLPIKMKTDIAINVHINTLNKVKLFADCDEALRRELVLELKSVIYLPGDIICKKGDVGKEMYIIQSGKVQVIGGKDNSEVLATLSEGSVFGEISLLGIPGMNRRTADVRSYGYSNLFVLDKASLNQALSHYPEAQDLLNKKAKSLMKKNAAMEQKNNAMIVIDNPTPPEKSKFVDTVMQVLPPDSKSNRLLRYGSRQAPKRRPENDKFRYRNSLPTINNDQGVDRDRNMTSTVMHDGLKTYAKPSNQNEDSDDSTTGTKITIHRTLKKVERSNSMHALHVHHYLSKLKNYNIVFENEF